MNANACLSKVQLSEFLATEQKIAQCEEFIRTTTKLPSDQF